MMIIQIRLFLFSTVLALYSMSCTEPDALMDMGEEVEETEEIEEIEVSPLSFLALGDSYTIGQGVPEEDRWPLQLQRRLIEDSIQVDSVKIIAQTGWTTSNLLNAIDEENPTQYDLVSLLIGVNNQYQGKPFSLFEEGFNLLLDKAIELSVLGKERVFVVSIPDYGVTPFGAGNAEQIAEELDAYNLYMKEECASRNILYIEITELSRMLGADNGALASDNLHPSGYQYGKWVEEIKPEVVKLLD